MRPCYFFLWAFMESLKEDRKKVRNIAASKRIKEDGEKKLKKGDSNDKGDEVKPPKPIEQPNEPMAIPPCPFFPDDLSTSLNQSRSAGVSYSDSPQADIAHYKTHEIGLKVIGSTLIVEGKHKSFKGYMSIPFIHRYELPPNYDVSDLIFKLEKSTPMRPTEVTNPDQKKKFH